MVKMARSIYLHDNEKLLEAQKRCTILMLNPEVNLLKLLTKIVKIEKLRLKNATMDPQVQHLADIIWKTKSMMLLSKKGFY